MTRRLALHLVFPIGLACLAPTQGCTRAGWAVATRDAQVAADGRAPASGAPDRGPDSTASGTVPPVTCDDWREGAFAFEAIAPMAELHDPTRHEEQPQLSYDGLTINFGRGEDVYEARRPTAGQPFAAPTPVPGLATTTREAGAFVSADRLTAYVMTDDSAGLGDLDLWLYGRATPNVPFEVVRNLAELNTPAADWDAFLTYDGSRLYGARVVDQTLYSIWAADAVTNPDRFTAPRALAELDEIPLKGNPSLTYDERVIVFNGRLPGETHFRFYYATRVDRDAPFGPPRPIPGFEALGDVTEPFVTADGCTLLFAWKLPQSTQLDLYQARYVAR